MKRSLNAQEQALRIQSRRRMIGAAVIMLCVVLLLPMILNHSTDPKLSFTMPAPVPPRPQEAARTVASVTLPRVELPQPAVDTAPEPAPSYLEQISSEIPVAPSADARAGFLIQVGVFSDRSKAQALVKKLNDQAIHAFGEVVHTKDGSRAVRVRVGPLHSKAEALAVTHQLERLGQKSMIISP